MKTPYLVCYDIADPVRLSRVFRLMKKKGVHVQYSVFMAFLVDGELEELKERLFSIIKKTDDDVRIYPLPKPPLIHAMGRARGLPQGVELFVDGLHVKGINRIDARGF